MSGAGLRSVVRDGGMWGGPARSEARLAAAAAVMTLLASLCLVNSNSSLYMR